MGAYTEFYSGQYGKGLWSCVQLLGGTSYTWIKPVLEFYRPLAVLQPLSIVIVDSLCRLPLAGRVGYHLGGVRWLALRDTDACIENTECVECEQAMLGCELYIMALTDWELSITRHMVLWWTGHSVSVISCMYVCIVRLYIQCTCTCAVLV